MPPGRGAQPRWEGDEIRGALPEASSDRVVLRRDGLLRRTLAGVDAAAAALALTLSVVVIDPAGAVLRPASALLLPVVVVVAKALGLYDRDQHVLRKTTVDEAPAILNVAVLLAVAAWLGQGFFVDGKFDRTEVFGIATVSFAVMAFGRVVARHAILRVVPAERCLVLGNAGTAARLARKLSAAPSVKTEVIGRVALDEGQYVDRFGGPELLGHVDSLGILLVEHSVERVIIAPDGHDQGKVLQAIRLVKALGAKVSVLPQLLEVVGSSSTFDDIDGVTLLGVRHYGLSKSSDMLKRAMDVVCVGVGVVLIAPLLIVIAAAIRTDSRGPIFFRQRRIGRGGTEFEMLKFRSMVPDADRMKEGLRHENEAEGLFKIEDDPRITRVGRFLRRTSLDELPQLLNVLKGDMSLVGPRPLVPDEDALIEGWQRRRLAVKPGMTGLWQIFGSSRIPMHEMVKIDYLYGANWSLWFDVKILLKTVPYVITRRGL